MGKEINLIAQLEGEGAGFSRIGLPTMRKVDISQFDLGHFSQVHLILIFSVPD